MAYKYQTLFKELKSMAERMPERAQLPSVRNIMDVYGVSQATVDRAIDELRASRIIKSVEGEGFFVMSEGARKCLPKNLKVCLAQNDYPSTMFAMIEEAFEDFYQSRGHELQVVRYPWAKGLSGMLKPGLVDLFIALPPSPDMSERELDFIKALDIPAICLSTEAGRHGVNSIGTDYELGGMMAAEHLMKLGHRQLAFLSGEPFNSTSKSILSGFRRQCQMAGLEEPRVIDCGTKPGQMSMRSAYEGFKKALKAWRGEFSGVFSDSDCSAIGAVRACHECGVKIPSGLSLIGFNGAPESEFSVPSISTLCHNLTGWAEASFEILRSRVEGKDLEPKTRLLAPFLSARESSGRPPTAD